jgi:hypothetical protein
MLQITIPAIENWDQVNEIFIDRPEKTLQMEHSLVSVAKWEAKWKKPFFGKEEKTREEVLDYIRCMTLTKNVDPDIYLGLTDDNVNAIKNYISDSQTATWFAEDKNAKRNHSIITAEIIYYWMIALQIPLECQKWHLNRLLTLIRVCNEKNKPPKKMSKREIMSRNSQLNAARRAKLGSMG